MQRIISIARKNLKFFAVYDKKVFYAIKILNLIEMSRKKCVISTFVKDVGFASYVHHFPNDFIVMIVKHS